MKNLVLILAMSSVFSTAAMAAERYTDLVKSVSCASGQLNLAKTVFQPGQLTTLAFFSAVRGSSLATAGQDNVLVMPVSGEDDGVCQNGNQPTLLIISASK